MKHPACWSEAQGLNFIAILVSQGPHIRLPGLTGLVKESNWARNHEVKLDVDGDPKYWAGKQPPKYEMDSVLSLGRYYRNKALHFGQLHLHLKATFGGSVKGLLDFCNKLVDGGDLVFSLWKGVNQYLRSMEDYWA